MTHQPVHHRERMEAALDGQILDRPPVALWRHFPVDDQRPATLAAAVAAFQNWYDFDFIKVTPSSSYCLYDWGAKDTWSGNPEGTRDYSVPVIHQPKDWADLRRLDPTSGHLGGMLDCLRMIQREFSTHTPVLQTIFSPLSQAKNLVGKANLVSHLREHPDELLQGLETITQGTIDFIEEAAKTGISGIFYAVQHAQHSILSVEEYRRFGRIFDERILAATGRLWLNLLHIHGNDLMFDELAEYPVQMINWHDRQTAPSLKEGQERFRGVVCGGLRQWDTMVLGTPEAVRQEAGDALAQTGGQRFVLGTGCVLPITAPHGNIMAARTAVERG